MSFNEQMSLNLRNKPYKGKLIAFEGTDGAGKTTLINKTTEWLRTKLGDDNVLCVKQPTDMSRKTKLFQKMMYCANHEDIDYRAVQLLTMSDRIQHGTEVIEPALKAGKTVICDRYIFTSLANMLARGFNEETWFFEVTKNLLKPDFTFLAYVNPSIAISRIRSRPEERERHLNEELLKRVALNFIEMAERESFIVLDTSGNADSPFSIIKNELGEIV